jgi:Holliday junction resolvase RusA-like endonuclease
MSEIITPLCFTVPGTPVAQPRVKATIRGAHAGVYSPTKTSTGKSNGVAEFKAAIRLMAGQFNGALLTGPLRVDIEFVFPRQQNRIWKTKPMPRYRHTQKPDRDNLDKLVLDSLSGVLWVDDNQVCDGRTEKWYAAGDEKPHVFITVQKLD